MGATLTQAAATREMRTQELHLIHQDIAPLQEDIFHISRLKRHCQQGHSGLLRGTPTLGAVTVFAGSHHIRPDIAPAPNQGLHMVTGQVIDREMIPAIHTDLVITPEQGGVIQGRGISFTEQFLLTTIGGNDGIQNQFISVQALVFYNFA